jgi:pyruvate,water dikinase
MPPDPLVISSSAGRDPQWHGRTLKGMACSAGIVVGTAKVLLSLDDAWKLEPGDIMVCRSTMPAWTPLFGVAGGIVADAGGPLSHCAIVAREYRIPCVAGTQVATHEIRDGMRLRVDGGAGTVELLD